MTHTSNSMIDLKTRISAVVLYFLGPVGMSLVPFMVGVTSDRLGLTPEQTGILASADLAGLFIASLSAVYWVRKISWRRTCVVSLLILITGNLLSAWATDYLLLCGLRFFTELGSGILLATIIACIGDFDKPDRYYAFGTAGTVSLSIAFFLGLPPLIDHWGAPAIYFSHAALAAMAFGIVGWLPARGMPRTIETGGAHPALIPTFLAMTALFCFAAAEGGLWSYLERIGRDAGFSLSSIGKALAIANLMGAVGAMATSALSTRFGRSVPVCLGLIAFIVGSIILIQKGISSYILGMALTQFCWGFTLPYIMLMSVEFDTSGRYFILLTAFKLGGFALGPALVALFLSEGSYLAVIWVCSVFLLLCLALIAPLSIKLDNRIWTNRTTAEPLAGSR